MDFLNKPFMELKRFTLYNKVGSEHTEHSDSTDFQYFW